MKKINFSPHYPRLFPAKTFVFFQQHISKLINHETSDSLKTSFLQQTFYYFSMYTKLQKKLIKDFETNPSKSTADQFLAKKLLSQLIQKCGNNPFSTSHYQLFLHFLLAWKTKSITRYFISENENRIVDKISQRWSTGFYRINQSLSILKKHLQGGKILDPYAGSGSLQFSLMILGIFSNVTLGDISYQGKTPIFTIKKIDYFYDPLENKKEYQKMLNTYQRYLPHQISISTPKILTLDATKKLPFSNNSFDYILTDPPYGSSLKKTGLKEFSLCFKEFFRVSTNGIIAYTPSTWAKRLTKNKSYQVNCLTKILTHAQTSLPTKLIHIKPNRII